MRHVCASLNTLSRIEDSIGTVFRAKRTRQHEKVLERREEDMFEMDMAVSRTPEPGRVAFEQ